VIEEVVGALSLKFGRTNGAGRGSGCIKIPGTIAFK